MLAAFVITLLIGQIAAQSSNVTFKAAAFNIRFGRNDNIILSDSIANLSNINPLEQPFRFYNDSSEESWSQRRIPLAEEVLWNDVSLVGMQEVLYNQLQDLQSLLQDEHSDYQHIGVGRADNYTDDSNPTPPPGLNEFSPLFFRSSAFELQNWDTFWLSLTPFDISQHPNTTNYRIATTARFSTSAGILTVINTHWDHQSDIQRQLAASLILRRAQYEVQQTGRPVLLFGDFNSETTAIPGALSGGYEIITGQREPVAINDTFAARYPVSEESEPFFFQNLRLETPARRRSGHFATFTGFGSVQDATFVNDTYTAIDFIFASNRGGWTNKAFRTGSNFYDDSVIFSDHRPVIAEIELLPGEFY